MMHREACIAGLARLGEEIGKCVHAVIAGQLCENAHAALRDRRTASASAPMPSAIPPLIGSNAPPPRPKPSRSRLCRRWGASPPAELAFEADAGAAPGACAGAAALASAGCSTAA